MSNRDQPKAIGIKVKGGGHVIQVGDVTVVSNGSAIGVDVEDGSVDLEGDILALSLSQQALKRWACMLKQLRETIARANVSAETRREAQDLLADIDTQLVGTDTDKKQKTKLLHRALTWVEGHKKELISTSADLAQIAGAILQAIQLGRP